MKKRILASALALSLAGTAVAGLVGCTPGEEMNSDPNVLNVKYHAAGYGQTYVNKFKEAFEAAYAAEGYKINVLAPDATLANELVLSDIYASKTGSCVDIYIAGVKARDSVEGTYAEDGALLADITESVYNQKAIGGNGQEEEKKVSEKIAAGSSDYQTEYNGKMYGLPLARSLSGLAVNKKLLESYGLSLPVTTNDLSNCIDVIMKKSASDIAAQTASRTTAVMPMTYSTDGKNNYVMGLAKTWLAQENGMAFFNKFNSFVDENGNNMVDNCADVFAKEYTDDMFASLFEFYDSTIAVNNFASQTFIEAQNVLMKGGAVFCPTGDWFLNEEIATYPDKVGDVTFIKSPMLSSLGQELFGSHGEEKAEAIFKAIIAGADANKDVATIKAEVEAAQQVTLTEEQVKRVAEARGYCTGTIGACAYVSAKSDKQDLAALFLRFMAGDEGAKIFSQEARTCSPFMLGQLTEDANVPWYGAVNSIFNNQYYQRIPSDVTGYREALGVTEMFFQKMYLAGVISSENCNMYNYNTCRPADANKATAAQRRAEYKTKATSFAEAIHQNAQACVTNGTWKLED